MFCPQKLTSFTSCKCPLSFESDPNLRIGSFADLCQRYTIESCEPLAMKLPSGVELEALTKNVDLWPS